MGRLRRAAHEDVGEGEQGGAGDEKEQAVEEREAQAHGALR